jgi:septal ring factor EnvC (AmiA/AmiB activator)
MFPLYSSSGQCDALYQKGPDAVFNYVLDLHKIIEHLSETVQKQQEHIQKLETQITKLEEALNKDSHNSNKLPLCSSSGQCSLF